MVAEKNSVKNLFNNLKSSIAEPIETPTQAVAPVKQVIVKDETPFTLHFPTKRLKMLKVKAAEDEVSIKELVNKAIFTQYGF